jgi:hypothetical protein
VLRRARGHKAELSLCLCVVRLGLENGKWKMENGKWKMENGKWK